VTVDHLALEEGALEVGGDEVDAADAALHARGLAEEDTCRAVAKGRGERLVEVDARLHRACSLGRIGAP
jgi:hypothetical protein